MKTSSSSAPNRNLHCTCPTGKTLIGGGARIIRNDGRPWEDIALLESYPYSSTQWFALAAEGTETDAMWQLEVYAICAATSN